MRILITGAKGQLGTELRRQLEQGGCTIGEVPKRFRNATVVAIDLEELDLTDKYAVKEYLRNGSFDIVFNCAAYTNVDGCESHREDAYRVNALAPLFLAEACEKTETQLFHVSTDYVFPGTEETPRTEYDVPCPISVYGKTKYARELYVRDNCSRYFIIRTAWLYGSGKNFVRTILRVAKEKGKVTVVNDQFGNPTSAVDLAYHMLKIADSAPYGLYHGTNNGVCSWYDFAKEFVALAGIDAEVLPCTTAEYPTPTKRPAYSALDNLALRATVGDEFRPWQEAIREYIETLKKEGTL